jgi:hypothetical protein
VEGHCRSPAERNVLKIFLAFTESLQTITTAKTALSFQQKRAFIQEILFSLFKWGILTFNF